MVLDTWAACCDGNYDAYAATENVIVVLLFYLIIV